MANPVFTITHKAHAPIGLVWKCWTHPVLFAKWFGPKGFKCDVKTFDLRPGGVLHSHIHNDQADMWGKFVFRTITPHQKLEWVHSFADADGAVTRHPMHADWPLTLLTSVTLVPDGQATLITLTWQPLDASANEVECFAQNMESMQNGWSGTFDQLDTLLLMLQQNKAITPYLFFNGDSADAIAFYQKTLGAEIIMIMKHRDNPQPSAECPLPPGFEDKIMHAELRINGTNIMMSDGMGGARNFNGFSLSLTLMEDEIASVFDALSDGGNVTMPLMKTFWSPSFGMLTDKFGVNWMLMVPEALAA